MNNEFFSVSRIEGDIAILEFPDGSFNEVNVSLLPDDIKPGNILKKTEENNFIHINESYDNGSKCTVEL